MTDLDFDVVELDEPTHPREGETAPDFVRPLVCGEYWEDVSLSELIADGPVVLVFYPMDGAFPATYIWNELRDRGFDGSEIGVAGVSISTPYEHKRLLEKRGLDETDVRLYSDPANEIAAEYGIVNDLDGMSGISEPRPAVFVIDTDRTVQYAWAARKWPEFPEYDELENAVENVKSSS